MFFALCSSFLDCQFPKDFFGKLGYSRKSPNREEGGGWGYTFFEKTPGIFRFVTLPLEFPDKTSFHLWKFCMQTCMTPLGNSKVENQDKTHGNSTWFFLHISWKFHFFFSWSSGISTCSFFNTPLNSMSLSALFFFSGIDWSGYAIMAC